MKIVVETPKHSFVKYKLEKGKYVKAMTSPFPTLFNYGFIEGTIGEDKMPKDCIIIGRRLEQGQKLNLPPAGVVTFTDDSKEDDKTIFTQNQKVTTLDKLEIHAFFHAYAAYKNIRILAKEKRVARCKYSGYRLI